MSESESSPRGKATGADGEEEEEEEEQRGGEEKKTPRKEDEGGITLATNAEQTKDAIDIQLKPNMDPRLKSEIENAFETVTRLIHRMDAHNANAGTFRYGEESHGGEEPSGEGEVIGD